MALTLAERLVEAEAAYHSLALGQSVVEVRDASGDTLRYKSTDKSSLKAYINELKELIAADAGIAFVTRTPLRPMFGG